LSESTKRGRRYTGALKLARARMKGNTPPIFAAYVLGLLLLVLLGFLPSEVETRYTWPGSLLFVGLVIGLAWGSDMCRWILLVLGVVWSFLNMSLQSPSIEVVATAWSVTALLVTGLLLTDSMRGYTRGSR
jgi:hypothetical protein